MLTRLDDGLWVAGRPLRVGPLEIGTRMTVVRLPDGGLFVHSPVKLDDGTRAAVDALGPVRTVVGPNRYHHLYIARWSEAYPEASLWAAPGLADKRRDLRFRGILGDEPPPEWSGTIEQHVIGGAPRLGEVVFFHPASRTLLLTDLGMNLSPASSLVPRAMHRVFKLDDGFGPTRLCSMLFWDKKALGRSLARILQWDFDRITLTHGAVVEGGGRARFAEAYRRYLPDA